MLGSDLGYEAGTFHLVSGPLEETFVGGRCSGAGFVLLSKFIWSLRVGQLLDTGDM